MMMNDGRRIALATLTVVAVLLVGGVAVLWSWNAIAVDLFEAPVMKFKHALAAELMAVTIAAIGGLAWRVCAGYRR